jgi:hypothetical protein
VRIRSIKPEFWTSEDIAALDWDTRLIFIGLWSYVDDNGVGRDVEKLILADLFPLEDDPRATLARLSEGLNVLADRGLIVRYEVDGKRYLFISAWDRHQKIDHPSKGSLYPRPTSTNADPDPSSRQASSESRETLSPGTGEQGNRGTGTDSCPAEPDVLVLVTPDMGGRTKRPTFADFYAIYPKHEARAKAEAAWNKATKDHPPEVILEGAKRYANDPNLPEKQWVPLPASWLNGRRWEDDPLPPRRPSGSGCTIRSQGFLTNPDADFGMPGATEFSTAKGA